MKKCLSITAILLASSVTVYVLMYTYLKSPRERVVSDLKVIASGYRTISPTASAVRMSSTPTEEYHHKYNVTFAGENQNTPKGKLNKNRTQNPGCISRKLQDYQPVGTDLEYYHPPIVQYAKLATGNSPVSLSYMDYMAILSARKFLSPEKILIHTYTDIRGKYWDLTQGWTDTLVQMNKVDRVSTIRGKTLHWITHQADYIKILGLYSLGGVVSDFDVIVVNGTKLKHMQSMSECVLSREGEYLNAGFSSCVRNSSFVHQWLESYYTDYKPNSWLYNAAFWPKYILEGSKGDSSVCYNMYLVGNICTNPTYAKAEKEWLKENGVDWHSKVAAHYFNTRIRSFDESVLTKKHSFGRMMKYVDSS